MQILDNQSKKKITFMCMCVYCDCRCVCVVCAHVCVLMCVSVCKSGTQMFYSGTESDHHGLPPNKTWVCGKREKLITMPCLCQGAECEEER